MSFRVLQTNLFLKRTREAKKISSPEVLEDLINRRQTFFSEGDHDEVTSLYKQIKKGARADRKRHRVNQFRKCPQVTASEVTASDRKWSDRKWSDRKWPQVNASSAIRIQSQYVLSERFLFLKLMTLV